MDEQDSGGSGLVVGSWETKRPDGTVAELLFGADGILTVRIHPKRDESVSMACTWEVLEAKGDRYKLRRASLNKLYLVEQEFQFQSNNRLVIEGPFPEKDSWVVNGPDGKATYQRTN